LVKKVVLDQRIQGVVATGVRFRKDQKSVTISAQREVILTVGTTQITQILELSGIGRSSVLQAHGLTPVIDHAGVGEHLQDRGIVPLVYEVADGLPSGDMAGDPAVDAAAMAAYQKDGPGHLGMVPLISAFMPCVDLG
jgi:choline dehydrogenase-like flavoprotein